MVDGGAYHSAALKRDGTVWVWGGNDYGQLGDGTIIDKNAPLQVVSLEPYGIKKVVAGDFFTVALMSDGTVWAWGDNDFGQLGDGTNIQRTVPVQVKGEAGTGFLSGITDIAAGSFHSLALRDDGTVWAWGYNFFGQLGDGSGLYLDSNTPVSVSGLSNVSSVSAGVNHSLALKSDGTVWAWGWNDIGQLGDGSLIQKDSPVQVLGEAGAGTFLSDVQSISSGGFHSTALKNDGAVVWVWGDKDFAQLGDGTVGDGDPGTTVSGDYSEIPVQTTLISDVIGISSGNAHTLAIDSAGLSLWAWGSNDFGQLGNGSSGDRDPSTINAGDYEATPVQVVFTSDIYSIGAGFRHSLASTTDGGVWVWGENDCGQLGNGNSGDCDSSTKPTEFITAPALLTDFNLLD